MPSTPWTLDGADGQPIFGDTHLPATTAPPKGVLILCHGFKGYKDYGFLPVLAQTAADAGFIAHRFNFSHSGMTNRLETFERPDLFAKDTWGKQIEDLTTIVAANAQGQLPHTCLDANPASLPTYWLGHSRGGVTVLLTAGRVFDDAAPDNKTVRPAGLITLAAPSRSQRLDDVQVRLLKRQGYLESPSARTGQALRIGLDWLEEMERDPSRFDVQASIQNINCPILIVHGDQDATVPPDAAHELARHAGANSQLEIIPGASHTFNAPNPPGRMCAVSPDCPPQTREMIESVLAFLHDRT